MQEQMSFLEMLAPARAAPVWAALDEQQRKATVTALARLIAKVAAEANKARAAYGEEDNDE